MARSAVTHQFRFWWKKVGSSLVQENNLGWPRKFQVKPIGNLGLAAGFMLAALSEATATEDTENPLPHKHTADGYISNPLYLSDSVSEISDVLDSYRNALYKSTETQNSRFFSYLPSWLSGVALSEASAGVPSHESSFINDKHGVLLTRSSIADAAAMAAPAVVNITVSSGGRGFLLAQTGGSGFIIHSNGTILTNAHVVAAEGMGIYKDKITVTMQNGRTFQGEVVSFDLLADIAVLKVLSKKPLPTVKFGSSHNLRPGEWVIALGSPLHLQNTVTVGIISCVDRKSADIGLRGIHTDYIQTDAAINQGNSGGPLLNLDGEVIGINTMKAVAADGVSFAIPIDTALKIIEQLNKHGRVMRPWLGMKMLELTEDIIAQLKERDTSFPNVSSGVLVPQVIPGSPAQKAGVRPGDVIVEFNGKPVNTTSQIVEALGDKIRVEFKMVVRRSNGGPITLSVITEEASPNF